MNALNRIVAALLRDRRGAALPLIAAAMIPILMALGTGIDMARAYMVKAKLQEAVDSAALAGRRSMVKEDLTTAKADVDAFLAFNFPNGTYQTTDIRTKLSKPDVGTVRVEASTDMATTIMAIMGIKTIPISVIGEAKQNFDNVDIMLVLDTTGSMLDTLGSQRKIDALKDAVKELYKQLADAQVQLANQGLRMRFGIVPYSGTVNVGKLLWTANQNYVQTNNLTYWHWKATKSWFFTSWSFGPQTYNLANYVNGGTLGNINGNSNQSSARWAGCIEERDTVPTITGNDPRDGPPTDAYDLDIDMIPTGDNSTKWKPYVFDPLNGSPNEYCPTEATELKEMAPGELGNLADKLVAQGSTYHDIGMIWGTRMLSNGGIYGSRNPMEWKQRSVQKYIIFMTDGMISAPRDYCTRTGCNTTADHSDAYSAWGIEGYDRRVGATSDADSNARHNKRFLMACNEAKARKISVWTIAFGTGRVATLDKCASNTDQSSIAVDSDDLIARFAEIGRNIGPLRISK